MKRILVAIAVLAFATQADADPVGSKFHVNTYTLGSQDRSALAGLSGGGFVVTWESSGQDGWGTGVHARRYNAFGQRLGPEFGVNTSWRGNQFGSSVTGLSDGGFVIVWYSQTPDASGPGLYGQRYLASGARLGGEFVISKRYPGFQLTSSVAPLPDGGFVIAFTTGDDSVDIISRTDIIAAQRFSAGTPRPVGSRLVVGHALQDPSWYSNPRIAVLAGGGFVVTWLDERIPYAGVYARVYNASGNPLPAFRVAAIPTIFDQFAQPTPVALKDGSFVVVWGTASPCQVLGQRYMASGIRTGTRFRIDTIGACGAAPAALPDGGFIVGYQVNNYKVTLAVYGQRYDSLGKRVGSEFVAAGPMSVANYGPAVTGLNDGGFVMTWTGRETAVASQRFGIFGQRFSP